jgi:hypothetical protein
MIRYIPIVLGVLVIVALTIPQIYMTDRFSDTNVTAEQQAELLKLVPNTVGDWHGDDRPVDPTVKEAAGSVGAAVSRTYRNSRTGERVDLWLIVGHARHISAHTPDICYPASGFEARAKENSLYPLIVPGLPETPFLTNTFYKEDISGRQLIRVFWTWYDAQDEDNQGKVVWDAPHNARWRFGNSRALYKMYFTAEMRDLLETAEQSSCLHFARDFLPVIDQALSQLHHATPSDAAGETSTEQPPASADTPAAQSAPAQGADSPGTTPSATGDVYQEVPAKSPPDEVPPATLAPVVDTPVTGRIEEIPGSEKSAPAKSE